MIKREVTQTGNPVIRKKSAKIKNVYSRNIKKVVQNLIDSMRHHELVGMAAPQIGVNLRIFVTEIRKTKFRKQPNTPDLLRVYINPRIVRRSKKEVFEYEGCGSVAFSQLFALVKRPESIVIRALNKKGEEFELKTTGLLSRVIQHEFDHIEGKIFLDREFDRKSIMSKNEYLKQKHRK
jgi:peptide deformylase